MPATDTSLDAELLRGYELAPGAYDEVFSAPGVLRPAWKLFLKGAEKLTRTEYMHRWEQAQRLLRQNSLTYSELSDSAARRRPWELDGLPLIISADEWRTVSAALQQRAMLLDLVLRDVFGPQTLVRDGVLPPEALFRHPGYRLPFCRPPEAQGSRMLQFYAADLARAPDGRWWVQSDRCESASGAGFALENRIALSRMLSDVFRQCRVERLAPYFIAVKELLSKLAPQDDGDPRIVILSQAAGSTNYFEDAFLARYLGYTLAEAGDLAVRRNRLYLKTLAGLSLVNVLLRRPNSERLDPLELADAGNDGTAGLLQAMRSGNVTIANTPGSGLVESPIFRAFMPRLAEKILGEPLSMPGVATWWCGEQEDCSYVLERLDELIILPAYRRRGEPVSQISRLADMSRKALAALIQTSPGNFVAQEKIVRSGAPAWSDSQLQPCYIALRTFAAAHGDGYTVMPGGLARVSTSTAPLELSLLDGERSKDAWVLADGPVEHVSLLTASEGDLPLRRGGVDLSSRAAEHFFWLGRHSVRAEALAKLIRSAARRLASEEQVDRIPELPHLLRLLAEQGQIEPGYVVEEIRQQLPSIEKQLPTSAFDDGPPHALRATVTSLVSLASTVRDLMSLDSWRIIHQMNDDFRPTPGRHGFLDLLDKIDLLLVQLAAYAGEIAESMTRTYAWRFLDLGRRLERALQESQLLRGMLATGSGSEPESLETLLEMLDSVMTYRSRYGSRFQLGAVLDLMLCDETNPRSVAYQLVECVSHVGHLNVGVQGDNKPADQGLAMSLLRTVRNTDVVRIAREYEEGAGDALNELLDTIGSTLPELSDVISHRYFFHSAPIQRLADIESKPAPRNTEKK
ncbi:MAG TPA: circularly permuted type 2 ATP-grasp protein [Lacipirellulaceae bacterium]|nr:circularly permuted type 2 ATP-grasp protein [Lacipirellulaceae bacterium]